MTQKQKILFGLLFVLTGVFIMLIAAGVIPSEESSFHAPRWVVGACGAIFSIAGIMIFTPRNSLMNNLLAFVLILCFGVIGGYVALYGESGSFSGGIPLISRETNISIGRIVFGFGSIVCFLISLIPISQFFKQMKSRERDN